MNEKKNITAKNTILRCGADKLLPFALVYIFYVILHGHLSPGGGFQGGVLMVAIVVLIVEGYGYEGAAKVINRGFLHKFEGFASVVYIAIAMIGVFCGAYFCQNVLFMQGSIGDLYSAGTIFFMDLTVGAKVLAGVGVLGLSMFALISDGKE